MSYKSLIFIIIFFLNACSIDSIIDVEHSSKKIIKQRFKNNGFALVYNDKLYKNKLISSKLENRDLLIFQRNLKKGSVVKITNNLNKKSVIAKVGKNTNYPLFNNSVLSERIAKEIELSIDEPYIEIVEVINNSSFIAKKAKTFDEEKKVANKAPIDDISINDLNSETKKKIKNNKREFSYIIKIADFYFIDSAKLMIERINNETSIKNVVLKEISSNNYRVFLGPYKNLSSLKKAFNDITVLNFENIEIIQND